MSTQLSFTISADTGQAIRNINATIAQLQRLGSVQLNDPTNAMTANLGRYRDALDRLHAANGRFARDTSQPVTLDVRVNSAAAQARINALIAELQAAAGRRPIVLPLSPFRQALQNLYNRLPAGLRNAFAGAGASITSFANQIRAATTSTNSFGSSLLAMGGIAAGVVGIATLADQFRKLYESIAQVERTFARLKYANNGDLAATAQDVAFAREQAERLGLPLKIAEDAYSGLAASMRAAGFSVAEVRETFLGVAEGARVLGLSTEDTKGVFSALSQIASKGTVSMEELRQQLGERLPVVMKVAADSMGMTTKQLVKLVSEGKVASKDFLARFGSGMRRAFEKELPGAVDSLQANVNRMGNAWEELRRVVGEDAGGQMSNAVKNITENLKDPDTVLYAQDLGVAIAESIGKAIELFRDLSTLFDDAGKGARVTAAWFEDTFGQMFRKIKVMWLQVSSSLQMGMAQLIMGAARSAEKLGLNDLGGSMRTAALGMASVSSAMTREAEKTAVAYDKVAKSGESAVDATYKQIAAEEAARAKRKADLKKKGVGTQENQNYDKTKYTPGPGKGDKGASALRSAELALEKADAEARKKIAQAAREQAEAELELSLERRKVLYNDYLDQRAGFEKAALAEEMAGQKEALAQAEKSMAGETNKAKKKRFEADAIKIRAEITALEKKGATIEARLVLQKEQFKREVDSLRVDIKANILDLEGKGLQASLERLTQETNDLLIDKRVKGDDKLEAAVRRQAKLKEDKLYYEEATRLAEAASTTLQTLEAELAAKVAAGTLTATEREALIRTEREKTLAVMREQTAEAERLAIATGDPAALQAIQKMKVGLLELSNESSKASRELRDGLIGDLKTGIAELLREGGKLKDLLRNIAINYLTKIADKNMDKAFDAMSVSFRKANDAKEAGGMAGYMKTLGEELSGGFFGALKSGWGLVSKLFNSISFDSITDLFKGIASGIGSLFSGLGSGAGGLGGLLSKGLSFLGFATGGLVTGPGTGTSDSIMARLSNREYVIKASAVRALGVDKLNYINRTGRLPAFATGGLVGSLGSLGGSPTVQNAISLTPQVNIHVDDVVEALGRSRSFEQLHTRVSIANKNRVGRS